MRTIETKVFEVSDLTEEQKSLIISKLEQNNPCVYWDYDQVFSEEQIKGIIFNEDDAFNTIFDNNLDNESILVCDTIKEVVNSIVKVDGIDFVVDDENIDEFRDEFETYVAVDWNLKQLARNSGLVNVRIHLKSNYDCINSHWFENQDGYSYNESYFGAMVDALNLNPKTLKKLMIENGFKCVGSYPNKKNRDGKEFVDYMSFINENLNSCCGANELVFVGKINLNHCFDVYGNIKTITIPKGNNCGIFSSMQGGGSIFECTLLNDLTIDLTKVGETMYDRFDLELETKDFGYSIDRVYGVTTKFFGNVVELSFVE